jgi:hypothetical protein
MAGLTRWEQHEREHWSWQRMIETWVKDVLDAQGEFAAMAEYKRLTRYDRVLTWDVRVFDPKEPERDRFTFKEDDGSEAWLEAYRASAEAGWPKYRPNVPLPDEVVTYASRQDFCDERYQKMWSSDTIVERHLTWDPFHRTLAGPREQPVEVRVKVPATFAVPGERIYHEERPRWEGRKMEYDVVKFVYRWRDVDELDTVVDADALLKAEHAGYAAMDEHQIEPLETLFGVDAPIEEGDLARGRVYRRQAARAV